MTINRPLTKKMVHVDGEQNKQRTAYLTTRYYNPDEGDIICTSSLQALVQLLSKTGRMTVHTSN